MVSVRRNSALFWIYFLSLANAAAAFAFSNTPRLSSSLSLNHKQYDHPGKAKRTNVDPHQTVQMLYSEDSATQGNSPSVETPSISNSIAASASASVAAARTPNRRRNATRRQRTYSSGPLKMMKDTTSRVGGGEQKQQQIVVASPAAAELQRELRRLSSDTANGVEADRDRRSHIEQLGKV